MTEFSLADLVRQLRPKLVVELGTGDGMTGAAIMGALLDGARFITVNWPNPPSGDNPARYLGPWLFDQRLTQLWGDTRDVSHLVPDGIDLLFIDSTHERGCAEAEWNLYRPKLKDGAVVVVDDLHHNDMLEFWDDLPGYDKRVVNDGRIGILRHKC